jgi:predicted NBD/HSP70 family sugar kinase
VAADAVPARPQLIRAMNEQLLLGHIRSADGISRADLARQSGLAKNTVSLALASLEQAQLVRATGLRTGQPGPAAILYEISPDAGYVLGLDVGSHYVRGAVCDVTGAVRARRSLRARGTSGHARVGDLVTLADELLAEAGITRDAVTQTVLGSPGVHDARRDHIALAGGLPGWEKPAVLSDLRAAFGRSLMIENDIDAAALAERAHGHGRGVDTFAFVSIGTGIGLGLVLGGRLHRGRHGAAGEIGYMPLDAAGWGDDKDARRRGGLEAAASAAGIVRAARRSGVRGPISARQVFAAAQRGEAWASDIVDAEASLVARAICAVVTVVDPELIVLGGGIGQADGFVDHVRGHLQRLAPVQPELKVSALGVDAVVDGCLAAGLERAWTTITDAFSASTR